MPKIKRLIVETIQGEAGFLEKEDRYVFNYGLAAGDRVREVALGMPIRAESYASSTLLPIFAMNRPEGFLHDAIVRRFAKFEDLDDMRLLSIVGGNQIGRLTYRLPDEPRIKRKAQLSKMELLSSSPSSALFEHLVDENFESGISGVQPKVLVADASSSILSKTNVIYKNLIVKAAGNDYEHLTQNEFLCMDAARIAGMEVAPFWLSDDGGLFVMERFDLRDGGCLGFEDMTVLMGIASDPQGRYKYTKSYELIARAISSYCTNGEALTSRQRFFEYMVLSVMVQNGDAHLKNFGLTYVTPGDGTTRLSPLYDVVTTSVYPFMSNRTGLEIEDNTLAIKMRGSKSYPTHEELMRFGLDICSVARPAEVLERIAAAMSESMDVNRDRVDPRFLAKIEKRWDDGRFAVGKARVFAVPAVTPDPDEEGGHETTSTIRPN